MTTSDVKISPGIGANIATFDITEDAEVKKIQRIALTDATGAGVTISGGAIPIALASGGNPNGQTNMAASAPVVLASDQSAVPVSFPGFTSGHIATSTTTTLKSTAGVLHSVTINSLGTVASIITIYDNTAASGTVIAIIDSLTAGHQGTYTYDVAFSTGLTLVTTGSTPPDVTVSYR